MKLIYAALATALTPLCSGQSFNLNFSNSSVGLPPTFEGAAGQPGVWNTRGLAPGTPVNAPLVDIAGNLTPVAVTVSASFIETPLMVWPCVSPETRALYESYFIDALSQGPLQAEFDGLASGVYRLHTYSYQPPLPMANIIDAIGSFEGPLLLDSTSICPNQPEQGRHYVVHTIPVSNGRIQIEVSGAGSSGLAAITGFQLERIDVGDSYCTAELNSIGVAAALRAIGSDGALENDLTLLASGLPADAFTLMLTSRAQGFMPGTNGSTNGNLCLAGPIGRFLGPGEVQSSGSAGQVRLRLDLVALPQGGTFAAALPGETWNFQCWYRDSVGFGSNLTRGLEVTFR